MLPEETRNLFGDAVRSGALLKAAGSARVCGRLQRGIVTLRAVIEKNKSNKLHAQDPPTNNRSTVTIDGTLNMHLERSQAKLR